ncbi:MAG: hypothetical protein SOZ84_02420 [Treponema sp.]|nr:hypothetical protein [Treponema sp.]
MASIDIIKAFLEREQSIFCDDCLSQLTQVTPRQQVNQICREHPEVFETHKRLKCSKCGNVKITRCLRGSDALGWDDLKKAKFHLDKFIVSQGGMQ